jgi:hypothetical protein
MAVRLNHLNANAHAQVLTASAVVVAFAISGSCQTRCARPLRWRHECCDLVCRVGYVG